jgi:hypothetical protein
MGGTRAIHHYVRKLDCQDLYFLASEVASKADNFTERGWDFKIWNGGKELSLSSHTPFQSVQTSKTLLSKDISILITHLDLDLDLELTIHSLTRIFSLLFLRLRSRLVKINK